MKLLPKAGDVFTVIYPFIHDTVSLFDGEDYADMPTWKPGVKFEWIGPEDTGAMADAEGKMILVVEDVLKPGRFPWRVFFTRKYVNPDGKEFGKSRLHIVTLEKFRRIASGYRYPYGIGEPYEGDARPVQFARETLERLLAECAA